MHCTRFSSGEEGVFLSYIEVPTFVSFGTTTTTTTTLDTFFLSRRGGVQEEKCVEDDDDDEEEEEDEEEEDKEWTWTECSTRTMGRKKFSTI